MRRAIIALALTLSACATGPRPIPPTKIETVEIRVPTPVPCIEATDVPAEPVKVGNNLTGDAPHDLDVVAPSAIRLRVALEQALGLIKGCLK